MDKIEYTKLSEKFEKAKWEQNAKGLEVDQTLEYFNNMYYRTIE
jgi:hypothetical protein